VTKKRMTIAKLLTSAAEPSVPATLFKAKCAESLDAVHEVQRVLVITKHGKPFVQVTPVSHVAPNPIGFMAGTVIEAGDIVSPDLESWQESETDPLHGRP